MITVCETDYQKKRNGPEKIEIKKKMSQSQQFKKRNIPEKIKCKKKRFKSARELGLTL